MQVTKKHILFFLLFFGIINCFAASLPTMTSSVDKIVVIVNDDVITQSQINQGMAEAKKELAQSNTQPPSDEDLRKQVVDNLITLTIERQMIKQANVVISDEDLNNAIENIAKNNNLTVAKLKAEVEKTGMSFAQYRKQISDQMQLSQLEQAVVGHDIVVSDQEVQDFLKKNKNLPAPNAFYHIENILIPVSSAPSPEELEKAKARAQQIVQQIKNGKNFGQIAAAESSGSSALHGGDLGWRQLPELPSVFADAVKNMQPGEIAGPLQAPNGFHIIKLVGIKGSTIKLDEQKVRALIYRRKFEEQLQIWQKQARDAAYIQYM